MTIWMVVVGPCVVQPDDVRVAVLVGVALGRVVAVARGVELAVVAGRTVAVVDEAVGCGFFRSAGPLGDADGVAVGVADADADEVAIGGGCDP